MHSLSAWTPGQCVEMDILYYHTGLQQIGHGSHALGDEAKYTISL